MVGTYYVVALRHFTIISSFPPSKIHGKITFSIPYETGNSYVTCFGHLWISMHSASFGAFIRAFISQCMICHFLLSLPWWMVEAPSAYDLSEKWSKVSTDLMDR